MQIVNSDCHLHFSRRGRGYLVAGFLLLSAGCGSEVIAGLDPPRTGIELKKVAGDSQVATPGSVLPESITVQLLDSGGIPRPGVELRWSVQNGGVLGRDRSTTGEDGIASNTWELGPTLGYQLATASALGRDSVTFIAQALENPPPPPVLQAVILTPGNAVLATGATQQFSVSGQWSNGATAAPNVTYSATGGSITSGGLYTAGNMAGAFRVIANQQGGSLADTATVNITTSPPPTAVIYFQDGFESGDLKAPTVAMPGWAWGASNSDGGSMTPTAARAKTGLYSQPYPFKAGTTDEDAWEEQRFVMGSNLTEVYVRFWLYIPSNYAHRNAPGSDNNKFFRIWATDYAGVKLGSSLFPSSPSNAAAGSDLGLEQAFSGGSMGQYSLPIARGFISPADYGKWMRVQLYFKLDTGGGNARMRVWKNYGLVLDSGNFANPAGSLANLFTDGYILGWSNSGFDAPTTLNVDDFVMANFPE